MALVDFLAILPDDGATAALRVRTRVILLALAERQQPSGLWQQVMDVPGLAGNYDESSASAMFSYAFLRAARHELMEGEENGMLRAAGLRALDALVTTRLVRADGRSEEGR